MQTNLIYQITRTTAWNESDMSILAVSTVIYPRFYHSYIISKQTMSEWWKRKKSEETFSTWMWRGKLQAEEEVLMMFLLHGVLYRAIDLFGSWNFMTTTLIGDSSTWKFTISWLRNVSRRLKALSSHVKYEFNLLMISSFHSKRESRKISSQPTLFIKPLKPFNDNNDSSLFPRASIYAQ